MTPTLGLIDINPRLISALSLTTILGLISTLSLVSTLGSYQLVVTQAEGVSVEGDWVEVNVGVGTLGLAGWAAVEIPDWQFWKKNISLIERLLFVAFWESVREVIQIRRVPKYAESCLPFGSLGMKLMVLVFARRFSPVPSIQMYIHWTLFEGTPSFMYLKKLKEIISKSCKTNQT